jgi:hypothetical protein
MRVRRVSARSPSPDGGDHRDACDSDKSWTDHDQKLPGEAEAAAPPQQTNS